MAHVVLAERARQDLKALPLPIIIRVRRLLYVRLPNWPNVSGAKPLKGELSGSFRLRTGDYRVQFHVVGDEIVVDRIGHRDGFYED